MKIAIVKHNGLFYGGTEKFLQIMAAKTGNTVDYYTSDLMRSEDRERYLVDNGVNVIKFKLPKTYDRFPLVYTDYPWKDFWSKFQRNTYDVVQITNFGWPCRPYDRFYNENCCEFTVFPPYVKYPGVKQHILNSDYLRWKWVNSGGPEDKATVIPVPVEKTSDKTLRDILDIDPDTTVCGFHQRNHNDLFSPIQLEAFKSLEDVYDMHMIVLNGSKLYKKQAINLQIQNITFLDYQEEVSPFLNTLDIYTHGRRDGETYGMVLTEALIHGLPIVSHYTPYYNAMRSVIKDAGYVAHNSTDYAAFIEKLINNSALRHKYSHNALEQSQDYTYSAVIPKINDVWERVAYE